MDCSSPGFSVHGILQARILEWVAFPYPGDHPDPGIKPGLLHCRWTLYCLSHQGSPTAVSLWTPYVLLKLTSGASTGCLADYLLRKLNTTASHLHIVSRLIYEEKLDHLNLLLILEKSKWGFQWSPLASESMYNAIHSKWRQKRYWSSGFTGILKNELQYVEIYHRKEVTVFRDIGR